MRKTEEMCVREAMDRRLSSLEASALRRARIRQRIEREEEPEVKRKLTIGMAFALIAALALGGAAVAAGLNLFELYGKEDPRLNGLAGAAVLESAVPAVIETEQLGATTAAITNAYYDGQSLIVGYSMENYIAMTDYTPTEAELENKELIEEEPGMALRIRFEVQNEAVAAAMEAFEAKVEKGEACGAAFHEVYAQSYALTATGALIPGSSEWDNLSDGGSARFFLRNFESPLPEEAQNFDSLTIRIGLHRSSYYYWFDGEDLYYLAGSGEDAGEMSATIRRSEAARGSYAGETEIGGAEVKAEAVLTPAFGRIVLTATERVFDMQDPVWSDSRCAAYRPFIADGKGGWLNTDSYGLSEDMLAMEIRFHGSGEAELPERLTLYLMHMDDMQDFWDYDDVLAKAVLIELNTAE